MITEQFEYDAGFGCSGCGFNFVTKYVDGRGNQTLSDYDDHGNLMKRTHRIPSIVDEFEYNQFGQMTKHTHPDNGSGSRREDAYTYYDSGPQSGYRKQAVIDASHFALTTTYEYDVLGNVIRKIDPRGHDTQYVVNALNQVVREISREVTEGSGLRYQKDIFYDANNNVARTDVQNVDDQGVLQANSQFTTTFEYELLNKLIRKTEEVDPAHSIVTEYTYDGNRNLILTRFGEATNGHQPANAVSRLYDERDMLFREIRAPGAPDQSTTEYDYDLNENRVRMLQGIEAAPRVHTYTYDGYDRLVATNDPMGNVTAVNYDANGNRVHTRVDGELIDVPGDPNNVRLSGTSYTYDPMDRMIQQDVEFFDADTQAPIGDGKATTQTFYSDNSQVVREVNDNGHASLRSYDTANRPGVMTDAKGNTITYGYDASNNVVSKTEVEKSDIGNPEEMFVTTYGYDGLDRLTQTTDNVGNTNRSFYDSRNDRVRTVDAKGNVVRYVYDGLNRLTDTIRQMTDTGDGSGNVIGSITTRQTWDDSSRLTSQIDDNGNATTYVYDALGRKVTERYADNTEKNWAFDAHNNAVLFTDANQNVATSQYDLLNRITRKDIQVGPGVSADTTFENYKFDGLSRLVSAEDDDSLVTQRYDSLSRVTGEIQNGQAVRSVYDGVGNESQRTYPGGRVISTTYDELERKRTISDASGMIASYDYVGPGRVTRRDYGNGTRAEYRYDGISGTPNAAGDFGVKRITATTHSKIADSTILDDRTYTWDHMGNKTQHKDVRGGGPLLTRDYGYDSVYRLVRSVKTPAS